MTAAAQVCSHALRGICRSCEQPTKAARSVTVAPGTPTQLSAALQQAFTDAGRQMPRRRRRRRGNRSTPRPAQ